MVELSLLRCSFVWHWHLVFFVAVGRCSNAQSETRSSWRSAIKIQCAPFAFVSTVNRNAITADMITFKCYDHIESTFKRKIRPPLGRAPPVPYRLHLIRASSDNFYGVMLT